MDRLRIMPTPEGTVSAFRQWYEQAIPGEAAIFWTGKLTRDRLGRSGEALDALADAIAAHARANMVFVDTRRARATSGEIIPGHWEYIVTRLAKRYK